MRGTARGGVVDEIEIGLSPSRRFTKNVLLDRSERDFTPRNRDVLNVLRPHLISLYRSAAVRRRAEASLAAIERSSSVAMVVLDAVDRIEFASPRARALLAHYGMASSGASALPPKISDWVRLQHTRPNSNGLAPPIAEPLEITSQEGRLLIHLVDGSTLFLEEESPVNAAERLTRREREILGLVAQGKTDAQIAADLWVTRGTVRKHLEHIFDKLEVGSRAAAVAQVFPGLRRAELRQ